MRYPDREIEAHRNRETEPGSAAPSSLNGQHYINHSQSADVAARDATTPRARLFNLSLQAEAARVGSRRKMALELHANRDADDMQDAPVAVPPKVGRLVAGRPWLAAADAIAGDAVGINSVRRSIAVETLVVALVEEQARHVA
eukprot:scaffold53653_cov70-Phaeocystis_antarctica.AAC.8